MTGKGLNQQAVRRSRFGQGPERGSPLLIGRDAYLGSAAVLQRSHEGSTEWQLQAEEAPGFPDSSPSAGRIVSLYAAQGGRQND